MLKTILQYNLYYIHLCVCNIFNFISHTFNFSDPSSISPENHSRAQAFKPEYKSTVTFRSQEILPRLNYPSSIPRVPIRIPLPFRINHKNVSGDTLYNIRGCSMDAEIWSYTCSLVPDQNYVDPIMPPIYIGDLS